MKEEGQANPSQCILERESNKNLCICGDGAEQVSDDSWSIVIFEKWIPRETRA